MTAPLVYPKADFETQNYEGAGFHWGPLAASNTAIKFVPHTTEGGSWPDYDGGASAPHVTFKADFLNKRVEIRQHWDLNRYARALATGSGLLINNAGAIQAEFVGTSGWASGLNPDAPYDVGHLYVPGFPDWFWDEVAEFVAWLHLQMGLLLQAEEFHPWNATGERMGYEEWLTYSGVIGHQTVPRPNAHVDPGAIPIGYVLDKARAILTGRTEPVAKTKADILALERELRARGFIIYCGPSHSYNGVCRKGNHGHDDDSYHWLAGAIDIGLDPSSGAAISNYERAHLDRLATELRARGFRVLWNVGPGNHQDHLHVDISNYRTIINLTGVSGITLKAGTFPDVPSNLNKGFDKAYVKTLQADLNLVIAAGLLKVTRLDEDGSLGPATTAAVKAYQTLRGLVADGLPGPTTRARLDRDLAALKPASAFAPAYVTEVQRDLNRLIVMGWLEAKMLEPDGSLGPATQDVVKAYQKAKGLKVDGLPGGETQTAIKADLAQAEVNEGFQVDYVKAVQRDLNVVIKAGLISGTALKVDGSLGEGTRTVVRNFQRLKNLATDGLPGAGTRAALDRTLKEIAAPKPPPRTLEQRVAQYRVAGPNAYETNVAADKFAPPPGRGVIIAARDTPDVDSARTIASKRDDIHVFIVPAKGAMKAVTAERIKALKPKWVRAMGDSEAVAETALYQALVAAGIEVPL